MNDFPHYKNTVTPVIVRRDANMSTPILYHYVGYISSSHGIPCSDIKPIKKWSLILIQIISHLYFGQQIFGIFMDAFLTKDWKGALFTSYYIFCYICFIYASINLRETVEGIINFAERFLLSEMKRHLVKIEMALLLAYFIWFLFFASLSFTYRSVYVYYPDAKLGTASDFNKHYSMIPVPKDIIWASFINIILASFHGHIADEVGYVIIYCYLVYLIYVIKGSYLDYLLKRDAKCYRDFRLIWTEIIILRNSLEKNMSVVPFLAMTTLFVNATSVVVIYFKSDADQKQVSYQEQIRTGVQCAFEIGLAIPILIMPFFVSRIQMALFGKFDDFNQKIIHRSKEKNSELASLMEEIKTNLDMNLTGWGMFNLKKEFVLGFISSVITFSVLLLQLTQS